MNEISAAERSVTGRVAAALAATAALVLAAGLLPGAWLWGQDALRWQPGLGGSLWLLFALALVPGVGRRLQGGSDTPFAAWVRDHFAVILAGTTTLAVLLLPDRVHFLGDFLLRQGSSEMLVEPGRLAPQMLPLDHALHYELPTLLHARFGIPPNATGRLLGAASAAVLAAVAVSLVNRLVPRPSAWRAALAVVLTWGGWCLLWTGYMKAFVEMVWILPLAAVLALAAPKSPRAFLGLSALVTLALLLHRSAIGLVPVWGYLAWRLSRRRGTSMGAALVGAAPVLLTVAWLALRVVGDFGRVDRGHFSFTALADPLRLLDVANALWALCPLLLCLGPALLDRNWWREPAGRTLALLALPYIGLAAVLTPLQGIYRDLDVFAMSGMALAVLLAAALAHWDRHRRLAAWLALPVALGAVALTLPKLVLQSRLDSGLARLEAWVEGPPARSDRDRALLLEFMGARLLHAQRYEEGAAHLGGAARLAPSPRMLLSWAVASESVQDWDGVESALSQIVERSDDPTYGQLQLVATLGLAKVAGVRGDRARLEALAAEARRMAPESPLVTQMLQDAWSRLARSEAERAGRDGAGATPDSGATPSDPDAGPGTP